jgi:hypothetical protein
MLLRRKKACLHVAESCQVGSLQRGERIKIIIDRGGQTGHTCNHWQICSESDLSNLKIVSTKLQLSRWT